MTPTARTLAHRRRGGYIAGVVERWIPNARPDGRGIRRDLFGFIDVVAAKPGGPILGIQATAVGNVSHRLNKARGLAELRTWLASGARFQVWGWCKRRGRWAPRIVEVSAVDLAAVVVSQPPRNRRRSTWQPGELFGPAS
jgi:hypothetical protein